MTAENQQRGEVAVVFSKGREGERKVVLRPTYEAMAQIEAELGKGLLPLVRQFTAQQIGITEVVCVLFHGALAAGEKLERLQMGALVLAGNFAEASKGATDFLSNAITGGSPQKKSGAPAAGGAASRRKKAAG